MFLFTHFGLIIRGPVINMAVPQVSSRSLPLDLHCDRGTHGIRTKQMCQIVILMKERLCQYQIMARLKASSECTLSNTL